MKKFLTTDIGGYSFVAASKTVTFTGGYNPTLKQILAIVNTTRNVIIYNPTAAATGGTLSGQVLTLTYDTTGHSNTDQLMIAVDDIGPSISPAGFSRVTDEPRQIYYDPFDAALDTTNLWTTPTVGNSAVLASTTSGVLSMGTGTTASGWSKLFSSSTFKPVIPGWLGFSFAIALPDGAAPTANSYRFWGAGTPATTPTTAAPLTDAVGFELTTAGKLMAVVYNAGTRTQIADLSSSGNNTQPLDANYHRYIVYVRTDKAYFYIDSTLTTVATSNFQAPSIQTLPISLLAVGGSTPPGSNTQIQCTGLAVWDTAKNATQIADGTYPWRKAQVGRGGGLSVKGASISATSGAIAAAGTGTIGPTDVSEAGNVTFVIKNTIPANAWAGAPVLVFEQSDDNVSYGPLLTVRSDTGFIASTHTLGVGAANASIMFDCAMEGVNWVRCRVTTGPATNGITINIQPGGLAFSPYVSTKENRSSASTQSTVANSASNVTLLAVNANRLGATIFNDDTAGTGATLKVKLGATASATSFTVTIAPQGYYEIPFLYTGIIDGIASAATGSARITEVT